MYVCVCKSMYVYYENTQENFNRGWLLGIISDVDNFLSFCKNGIKC